VPKAKVTCPECDATLAVGPNVSAGQRIRCPRCETVFAVSDLEEPVVVEADELGADEPRRSRRRFKTKKQGMPAGLIVGIIMLAFAAVGAAAAGGYFLWKSPKAAIAKKEPVKPNGTGTNVGQLAPDIEGMDIDGVAFKLSDYRGKVVVLDFWGHW
jgi:hypothetical protein